MKLTLYAPWVCGRYLLIALRHDFSLISLCAPTRKKPQVALPHHLSPMAGLEDKLKKMRTDMEHESGNAPWDAFGRPRTALLGAKQHK